MYNVFYFENCRCRPCGRSCGDGIVRKWLDRPVSRETAMKRADDFDLQVYPVRARGLSPVSKSWIGADV